MELLVSSGIGLLTAGGVFLLLRARTFEVVLGLTLVSYAVNLFIFVMGRLAIDKVPLLREGIAPTLANHSDPLPQALVLTAIVISFAMSAVLLVLALRNHAEQGSDHVDGEDSSSADPRRERP